MSLHKQPRYKPTIIYKLVAEHIYYHNGNLIQVTKIKKLRGNLIEVTYVEELIPYMFLHFIKRLDLTQRQTSLGPSNFYRVSRNQRTKFLAKIKEYNRAQSKAST